ncbi:hypothetical protein AVEN_168627-1 [Araneus ventricosus]|uniref:Uncharacterized protein n=1 Tax=Araneus ventricosus TaxID=182803 RepID=A0A4Y2Q553_ARAVE|nr:hypothetical protein AVEN_228042-1 [Araneus ventricosus]GBN57707.1 hypothetical protein AVEN_237926-1 [Araneus ventricosus]GBN57727.1 hypothetical protein AVEN_49623-1 [Araneus ventricosus]GBN57760.1 hypothetical protein AVEN_168627-1 [Araneus ventricosus]
MILDVRFSMQQKHTLDGSSVETGIELGTLRPRRRYLTNRPQRPSTELEEPTFIPRNHLRSEAETVERPIDRGLQKSNPFPQLERRCLRRLIITLLVFELFTNSD